MQRALQVYMHAGCMCINAEKVHSIDLKQKLNSKQEMHVWKLHAQPCMYLCMHCKHIFAMAEKRN